jgi:hypothetical protein
MALKSQFHTSPYSHYVQAEVKLRQLANGPCSTVDPFEGTILIPVQDLEPRNIPSFL